MALMFVSYTDTYVFGAPKGGRVVSGTASFGQEGNLTVITAGNRSIINYQSFNIGGNEIVRFVQPNASASVLNRVLSPNPTNIFGQIQANGNVYIANPYGVFFRNGAVLNVGGLYAGAGKISDADFTSGNIHFTDLTGDVRNDGVIAADNSIALLGANVANNGTMTSAHGVAMMADGPDVYVGERNSNIFVQANGRAAVTATAAAGSITNQGTVAAPRVLLGAGDMYAAAIVNSGLLQGHSIAVNAGRNGTATIGGRLNASASRSPLSTGIGGNIRVLGGTVALQGATLDASGPNGGGSVRVGGDLHGGGTLLHAATTTVDAATTIKADATGASGNGGSVVLWSDTATRFAGQISAQGGAAGGNGGAAEVSSGNGLAYTGLVNLHANGGAPGMLLLDPKNITVDSSLTPYVPGTTTFASTPGTDLTIGASALATTLATTPVTLQANTDILFTAGLTVAAGSSALTLDAGRSIMIGNTANPNVMLSLKGSLTATFNDAGTTGAMAVVADRDPGQAVFSMASGAQISAPGGATISGGTLVGDDSMTPTTTIAANTGAITLQNISTASGTAGLMGAAGVASGAIMVSNNASTTTGDIVVNGTLSTAATTANTAAAGITLDASGLVTGHAINASGMSGGAGGAVSLTSSGISLNGAVTGATFATSGPTTFNSGASVTTTGTQTYTGALTLAADTTLTGGGNITINDAVDGSAAATYSLEVDTPGNEIFDGRIGASKTLLNLTTDAAGTVGGDTEFRMSLPGAMATNKAGVNLAGTLTTHDGVSFVIAGTPSTTAPSINSTGAQNYDGAAVLAANTYLKGGATIEFHATIDGGTFPLTLETAGATGTITLDGAATNLASLTTVGGAPIALDGSGVTTSGGQTYSGGVTLGVPVVLTSTAGGTIALNAVDGGETLTVSSAGATGQVNLGGAIGGGTNLTSLDVVAGQAINFTNGNVTTTGDQTYTGPSVLGAATTLTSNTNGTITLGAVTGAQTLTVSSAGTGSVVFAGAVGAGTGNALTSLEVTGGTAINLNGGSITTSGGQTYTGPVLLGAATTLTGTTLTLSSTINGSGATGTGHDGLTSNDLTLDFSTTNIEPTDGNYVNIANFTSSGAGGTTLDGTFQTTGSQTYDNAVTLTGDSTLTSGTNSSLTFNSTIQGAFALTLDPDGTGAAVFGGAVGGPPAASDLTSLTVNGNASITGGGAVTTTGLQDYTGTLSLGLTTTLTSTGGEVEAGGLTGNSHGLNVVADSSSFGTITTGGDLSFNDTTGPAVFTGTVTAASLQTIGTAEVDLEGGAVTTSGGLGQVYGGNVVLSNAATTTLTANGSGPITFSGSVNGTTAQALVLSTAGLATFGGPVGNATPLSSLSTGTGTVDLNGGSVVTSGGGQSYGGPVVLGAAIVAPAASATTTLTDNAGGALTFHFALGAAAAGQALSLGTTGTVTFDKAVGSAMVPLFSLTSTGTGPVDVDGNTINTSGLQDYTGALTLGGATTLTSTGGEIEAGSLVGNSNTLAVNAVSSSFGTITTGGALTFTDSTGPATFTGAVAAVSLQTVGAAETDLNGGSVTTSGAAGQVYGGPVVLGASGAPGATTLTANGGGPITFSGTLNGSTAQTLSLGTTGTITFTGTVGNTNSLTSLTTTDGGTVAINGGAVTTTGGGQTYGGPVVLGATVAESKTTTLSDAGGAITFEGKVDGNAAGTQALVVDTAGNTTFGGLVGSGQALLSLSAGSSTAGATITLNAIGTNAAPSVTTTAGQTYNGEVLLGDATVLQGSTLTLASTVDGAGATGTGSDGLASNNLTLDFSVTAIQVTGKTAAGGTAGTFNDIANFVSDGAGGTTLGGSFQTTGSQTYDNAATLVADATLTSGGNGNINFHTTVVGPFALTLNPNGTGVAIFNGVVGTALGGDPSSLTVNGNTDITGGGLITTTGLQDFTGSVTLSLATTLQSVSGAVDVGSLAGGGNNLTVSGASADFGQIANGGSLSFTTAGSTIFGGTVNAVSLLATASGNVEINGGSVVTTGAAGQVYDASVLLGPATMTTLTAGAAGPITFDGTVNATIGTPALSLGTTGLITFTGAVGNTAPLGSLTTTNGGTIDLNGGAVTTSGGGQSYGGPLVLGVATAPETTTLTDNAGGTVTFAGTVNGNAADTQTLVVNTSGNEIFNQLVGHTDRLLGLETDAAGTVGGSVQFNMSLVGQAAGVAGVNVGAGGLTINDQAVFNVAGSSSAKTPVNGTNNPTVTSTGPQMYASATAASLKQNTVLQGTSLTFPGGAAGTPAGTPSLTLDFSGLASLALTELTGLNNLADVGSGTTQMGGALSTVGYQYFANPVTLTAATTLTSSGGKAVTFMSTLDGNNTLAVNTASDEIFNGLIGSSAPLTSLTIDGGGGAVTGTTEFNMSLTGQPAGTAGVSVGVGGLVVNDAVIFNVAGTAPGSATLVSSPTVLSIGQQSYSGIATLARDTVLTVTGGGDVTFNKTLDGTFNLELNSPGNEVFNGQVGSTAPLLSLTTDGTGAPSGDTIFNVAPSLTAVTTINTTAPGGTATGAQTYNDGVLLNQGTTLASSFLAGTATSGGAITFDGTVNSLTAAAESLTVIAGVGETVIGPGATLAAAQINLGGAQVTFNQPVGNLSPLNVLTVENNGSLAGVTPTIDINNGGFTTTSGQTYHDAVVLSADTLLASGNATILFLGPVNSDAVTARALTLNTAGTVTFDGLVGNLNQLRGLAVTATGGTFFDMPLAGAIAGVKVGMDGVTINGPTTFDIAGTTLTDLTHLSVQSGGAQTYNGPITLSAATSLYSSGGNDLTLNGTVDGGAGLALNTAGNEVFTGIVGGTAPLPSLTTDALITPGGQTQFTMNVAGLAAGVAGVRVGAAGMTINDGVLFAAAGSTAANPTVLTFNGGAQNYAGAASVATDTVLAGDSSGVLPASGAFSGGGPIVFASTVTGTGATPSLTINTGTGTTTFASTVNVNALNVTGAQVTFGGAISGLNLLAVAPNGGVGGGPIDLNGGAVTTSAGQTYGSPVALGVDTLLADTGSGNVTFNSTLNGLYNLSINTAGATVFNAAVGNTAALRSLTTDAPGVTDINGASVNTANKGQLYNDPVVLGADTVLTDNTVSPPGPITFGSTVDSASVATPSQLTITGRNITFGGAVGATAPLRALTTLGDGATIINGGSVTTTTSQSYGSNLGTRIGAATVLTAGTDISFLAALDAVAGVADSSLVLIAPGQVLLTGAVGASSPLTSLVVDAAKLLVNGGLIATTGAQTYNSAAVLGQTATLQSSANGNIVFNSTVDGAFGLTVNTGGITAFNAKVGGQTPLTSLTTDNEGQAGEVTQFNLNAAAAAANAAGVNVAGPVAINDPVVFNVANSSAANPSVQTSNGAQTYGGAATLAADAVLTATGNGNLTFNSTVDGTFNLALKTGGLTTFNGLVGGNTRLASLTTDAGGTTQINGGGVSTTINGGAASGAQTYNDAVTLGADAVLASHTEGVAAAGGNLVFNGTVDGPHALTLNTSGETIFNQAVGSAAPLLTLTTNATGVTVLNGGSVVTTGLQNYGDVVQLDAGTTLSSQNTAGDIGDITFGQTVDGAFALTVNTGGSTIFAGAFGGTAPLVSVTTDAPGLTLLNGGSVTTTGLQTYGDKVELGAGTTLTSQNTAGDGGNITFSQTVDGGYGLAINTSGTTTFAGAVGSTMPLVSIKTDAPGQTVIGNAGVKNVSIATTGLQNYGDSVQLDAGATLSSQDTAGDGGAITFAKTVDGGSPLTVNTGGPTVFDGGVGGKSPLASLKTDAPGSVIFGNGNVTTTGNQTYNDGARIKADATFTSNGNGDITFGQTLDGGNALTVNTGGATTFAGLVGSITPLTSVTTDAGGTTVFSGGGVATSDFQKYGDPVTLSADATLTSQTASGDAITFNATVDGGSALTLNSPARMTFNGLVGSMVPLRSLTTGGTGPTVFNGGGVTTTDFQTYNNVAMLGAATNTFTSTGTGDLTFQGTVDGKTADGNALVLTTGGNSVLNGDVGSTGRLSSVLVTGALSLGGESISTAADQRYEGVVTVNPLSTLDARFVSNSGNLRFDEDVTASSSSLFMEGHRILAKGNITSQGDLDLETKTIASAGSTLPLLLLTGNNYISTGGKVLFATNGDSTPDISADTATIVLSNSGTVNIQGSAFTMGYLQKMFSLGTIAINVGHGLATIGDIAARENLRITASQVDLLARPMGVSEIPGRPNDGLNFVADQAIDFGSARIVFVGTDNPTANFITTNGDTTIQRVAGVSLFKDPNLDSQFRAYAGNIDANNFALINNPLQPVGGGSQALDTAAALSGALPDQKPLDVAVDITISASQMEELKKLGIHPRLAKATERVNGNSKRALFAQLVDGQDTDNYGRLQPIKGGVSRLEPSDYVVVVDRMGEQEVQSILKAFEELYGKNKEKAPEIGGAFQTAYNDYTVQKQTADPAGFSPFLQSQPGKYPAVDTAVRGFDNLFGHIEHLGLTDKEVAKSEEHITSDLGVSGVSPEDMVKVINNLRKKLPPAQKAASNKAPASAPASNPAPGATAPAPGAPPPAKKADQPPPKTVDGRAQNQGRKTARRRTQPRDKDKQRYAVAAL